VEWESFFEQVKDSAPPIFLDMWMADYPDPDSFLRVCGAVRWSHWRDPDFQQLVDLARAVTHQEQRMARYRRAERILIENAAVIPLVYGRSNLLVQPWLASYPISAIRWWYWKDVVVQAH
jgi:ABC-type oligopeptide transport system substrate-binding subunit